MYSVTDYCPAAAQEYEWDEQYKTNKVTKDNATKKMKRTFPDKKNQKSRRPET
jgi:hypothetical protein